MPDLHTYMIQRYRMTLHWPLRFSGGERIIAVVGFDPVPGSTTEIDVTVLVELPADLLGGTADGAHPPGGAT